MSVLIEEDAFAILEFLIKRQDGARAAGDIDQVSEDARGGDIQGATDLPPARINDAVAVLRQNGFVDGYDFMGTRPFDFGEVHATPFGRFEYQRALAASVTESGSDANDMTARAPATSSHPRPHTPTRNGPPIRAWRYGEAPSASLLRE